MLCSSGTKDNLQCKLTAVIRRQPCSVAVVPKLHKTSYEPRILSWASVARLLCSKAARTMVRWVGLHALYLEDEQFWNMRYWRLGGALVNRCFARITCWQWVSAAAANPEATVSLRRTIMHINVCSDRVPWSDSKQKKFSDWGYIRTSKYASHS